MAHFNFRVFYIITINSIKGTESIDVCNNKYGSQKAFMLNYINQIKKEDILYGLILEHSKKCKQI